MILEPINTLMNEVIYFEVSKFWFVSKEMFHKTKLRQKIIFTAEVSKT